MSNKGTDAEEYVFHFANTAYLKQWCFPNPHDENGDKKEICDLLILFDEVCIIISVKNYDLKGNYQRFTKKVIEKSTKQLYGAERKLFRSKRSIFIKHPERGLELFEPSTYSKIIRLTINMGELYNQYSLGDIKEGKGFIHLIHRDSFSNLIKELDTIPDIVKYLEDREQLLMTKFPLIIEGNELDLLANYLLAGKKFPSEYFEEEEEEGLSLKLRGSWRHYDERNQQVKNKREADVQSYTIDKLVERDILNEKWGEELGVELMRLNRLDRRYVTQALYELIERYKAGNKYIARRSFDLEGVLYLLIGYPVGTETKTIDRIIEDASGIYMYKTDYQYDKIIILGTPYDLSESKYAIVKRTGDQNEAGKEHLDKLCEQYGWFQNMKQVEVDFKEFPDNEEE